MGYYDTTLLNIDVQVFVVHVHMFVMIYLSMEVLDHGMYVYLTLIDKVCFPNQFYSTTSSLTEFSQFHAFTNIWSVHLCNYRHCVMCVMVSRGFIMHLPDY